MSKKKVQLYGMPLSGLIRLAVHDIQRAQRSSWYTLHMSTWHQPTRTRAGKKCVVCMAGAVMAYTLGQSRAEFAQPFDTVNQQPLFAIDLARTGSLSHALYQIGVPATDAQARAVNDAQELILKHFNCRLSRAPWSVYLKAAKMLEAAEL